MFNLFRWSSNNENDTDGGAPLSLPPPPPPPPPSTQHFNAMCRSMDLMSTLSRIESKLDIILTKLDGSKRKKFTIIKTSETSETHGTLNKTSCETPSETPCETPCETPNEPVSDFVTELMKKVEEHKIAKHMGASHGFATIE